MKQALIEKNMKVLHFKVGNVHICGDLECIIKVISFVKLNPLPDGPNFLAGLMNYAGNSIPVIDLCLYLGLNRNKNYSLNTPILICKKDERSAGLIVDDIDDLTVIEKDNIQMSNKFDSKKSSFIGVIEENNNLSLLINFNNILNKNLLNDIHESRLDKEIINKVSQ